MRAHHAGHGARRSVPAVHDGGVRLDRARCREHGSSPGVEQRIIFQRNHRLRGCVDRRAARREDCVSNEQAGARRSRRGQHNQAIGPHARIGGRPPRRAAHRVARRLSETYNFRRASGHALPSRIPSSPSCPAFIGLPGLSGPDDRPRAWSRGADRVRVRSPMQDGRRVGPVDRALELLGVVDRHRHVLICAMHVPIRYRNDRCRFATNPRRV
jgi:hypothetical protein